MPDPSSRSRSWADHVRPRLATLDLSPARETEIVEELSQHLDLRYEELRHAGVSDARSPRPGLTRNRFGTIVVPLLSRISPCLPP